MSKDEVNKELDMSYSELCQYLVNKYGPAQHDYFVNEKCKSKNAKVSRTSEGLECHHADEDKAIMLSHPKWAAKNPFDYQKAERLVYCNVLEHLILHMKIVEEPRNKQANKMELPGLVGVVNYLCPQINDYYNGYDYKRTVDINRFKIIAKNFDDYITILKRFLGIAASRPDLMLYITKEKLSRGYDGKVIQKIYDLL